MYSDENISGGGGPGWGVVKHPLIHSQWQPSDSHKMSVAVFTPTPRYQQMANITV